MVILESGCDIYSYYPKNLASASVTSTLPSAQTNLGPAAFIQSAPADLWRSLKESLSSSAYLIQVLLLGNWIKVKCVHSDSPPNEAGLSATLHLKVKIGRRPSGSIINRLRSRWRNTFWFKHLTAVRGCDWGPKLWFESPGSALYGISMEPECKGRSRRVELFMPLRCSGGGWVFSTPAFAVHNLRLLWWSICSYSDGFCSIIVHYWEGGLTEFMVYRWNGITIGSFNHRSPFGSKESNLNWSSVVFLPFHPGHFCNKQVMAITLLNVHSGLRESKCCF